MLLKGKEDVIKIAMASIKAKLFKLLYILFLGFSALFLLIAIFLFFFILSQIDWFKVIPFAFLFLPEVEEIALSKLRDSRRKRRK